MTKKLGESGGDSEMTEEEFGQFIHRLIDDLQLFTVAFRNVLGKLNGWIK